MSVFKKSAIIAPPTPIGTFGDIIANINLLPDDITNRQLTYGTILSIAPVADIGNIILTLTGSFNGVTIQEQIIADNDNPISSVYFYDKITSLVSSADVPGVQLVLATGDKVIVSFDNYNTTNANNLNYNNFNILVRSIDANAGWGSLRLDNGNPIGYMVYGVSGILSDKIPNSYVIPNVTLANNFYPSNPYLTFINNIEDDITQNNIQNGYFVNNIYPYRSILVYISGVLESLTFLEITQS